MRIIRRVLLYVLVRSIVVSVVGFAALSIAAGPDTIWRVRAMLRDQPQAALMKAAEVLGR